jgi:hypothetical protein
VCNAVGVLPRNVILVFRRRSNYVQFILLTYLPVIVAASHGPPPPPTTIKIRECEYDELPTSAVPVIDDIPHILCRWRFVPRCRAGLPTSPRAPLCSLPCWVLSSPSSRPWNWVQQQQDIKIIPYINGGPWCCIVCHWKQTAPNTLIWPPWILS